MAKSSFDKMDEFRDVRELLLPKFAGWVGIERLESKKYIAYQMLSEFLNFRTPTMGILDWVDGDAETLELLKRLNGPNGYTIFRMKQINGKNK